MSEKKRRWGDRRDGRWVREAPGLQTVMAHLMPNRTDCEVYINESTDATELVQNARHPAYKTTLFHCFFTAFFWALPVW